MHIWGKDRAAGRVGSGRVRLLSAIAGQVGSGQRFAGFKKSYPWTTLPSPGVFICCNSGFVITFSFLGFQNSTPIKKILWPPRVIMCVKVTWPWIGSFIYLVPGWSWSTIYLPPPTLIDLSCPNAQWCHSIDMLNFLLVWLFHRWNVGKDDGLMAQLAIYRWLIGACKASLIARNMIASTTNYFFSFNTNQPIDYFSTSK